MLFSSSATGGVGVNDGGQASGEGERIPRGRVSAVAASPSGAEEASTSCVETWGSAEAASLRLLPALRQS